MRDVLALSSAPTGYSLVEIDAIDEGARLRPIDADYAMAIALSISQNGAGLASPELGLVQPISVKPHPGGGNRLLLVAGGHRLAAAKLLGWTTIPAVVRELSPEEARLAEIDENLFRRNLSALDRAAAHLERKRLYEGENPEAAHGRKKNKGNQWLRKDAKLASFHSYAADAARKTGFSKRSVARACELAASLGPELIASLRGTKLADNAAQLKALLQIEEPAERAAVVAALVEGRASNVARAKAAAGLAGPSAEDPDDAVLRSFLALWGRASAKARASIRTEIRKFDATEKQSGGAS